MKMGNMTYVSKNEFPVVQAIEPLGDEYKDFSVSHATMREEDLIRVFLDFLSSVGHAYAETRIEEAGEFLVELESAFEDDDPIQKPYKDCEPIELNWHWSYVDENVPYFLWETLFDDLNMIAPEGYYFGAHPGDGSDYGFWEVEEDF